MKKTLMTIASILCMPILLTTFYALIIFTLNPILFMFLIGLWFSFAVYYLFFVVRYWVYN